MSLPNLSALAVRERAVTLFFLLGLLVAGTQAFLSLGRAEDPAFTVRAMVVSVIWPGAGVEVLRDQVVDGLEKRIQEADDLYRIETTIRQGRADIQIEFDDALASELVADRFYQVRRRMQDAAASLPEGVIGPIVNEDFGDVYFSLMALTATDRDQQALVPLAEQLRDRLQRVPGTNKAQLLGERQRELVLDLDLPLLLRLGIDPGVVFDRIAAHNRLLPAGRIDSSAARIHIRLDQELESAEAVAAIPIRVGEQLLRVGDIAAIRVGPKTPPDYLVRAFGQDALLLGVVMKDGVNGLDYGGQLLGFLEQEQARLPEGVELRLLTNQAEAIAEAVNLFQVKFLIAVAVVMAVTVLAIGLRAGLVVGIAIPITLAATFLVMSLSGINLDRITLGALIIALGLLVDDAIIAIEMMMVKIEQGWDRVHAASHAWTVTAAPMLFGTLITAAGFVPIGFARSGVGEYAGNIFWVLAIALVASWIVAVTFTPYLGVKLLPERHRSTGHANPAYQSRGYRLLRQVVRGCLRFRKTVVALTFGLLVAAIAGMAGPVEQQFFPSSDRTEVLLGVQLPQGSAIGLTNRVTQRLESLIDGQPGVRSLSAYIGAGAPRFFISANPEQPDAAFARIIVVTDSPEARDRLMDTLQSAIAEGRFPEARIRVERLLFGPPVNWPVRFRVVGPDPLELRRIAHEVRTIMAAHPATRLAHLDLDERVPVFHLQFDPDRLARLGLTPAAVAEQLRIQLDGLPISQLRQGNRGVSLIAGGTAAERAAIGDLEISGRDGAVVSLRELASIEPEFEEPVLRRLDRRNLVNVNADVAGAQPNDVTAELWQDLQELRGSLPQDYAIQRGGSVEQSEKADASIQALQPVMLGLMLLFIMLQMRSFSGMVMVIATAPLGLIGAVAALLLFQQPFGFVALLGLIGLAGILMRNTLILTQQVSDNLNAGMARETAVIEAAVQRARPVVLTALAAALAFIPLTQDSFWGPLAYVLIGGVMAGTIITLLFVPALYALWFRIGRTGGN